MNGNVMLETRHEAFETPNEGRKNYSVGAGCMRSSPILASAVQTQSLFDGRWIVYKSIRTNYRRNRKRTKVHEPDPLSTIFFSESKGDCSRT